MSGTNINIKDSINKFNEIIGNLKVCTSTIDNSIKEIQQSKLSGGGDKVEKLYKKLTQYKRMTEEATTTAQYFKSLAEYYYTSHIMATQYYQGVVNKMMDMKDKMKSMDNQMVNIRSQYSNNNEKIQMLETFVDMMEKMTKNPTKLDLNIKNKFDDAMVSYDAEAFLDGKVSGSVSGSQTTTRRGNSVIHTEIPLRARPLTGGAPVKNYRELEILIQNSENEIMNSFRNVDFLNGKIKDLNDRMKTMVKENERIFEIRAQVDFLVNRLEDCVGDKCDQKIVEQNFEKLWNIIKGIQDKAEKTGENDKEMVDYIQGLEKYVGMLESQVRSSKRTIDGLSVSNKKQLEDTVFVEKPGSVQAKQVTEPESKQDDDADKEVSSSTVVVGDNKPQAIVDQTGDQVGEQAGGYKKHNNKRRNLIGAGNGLEDLLEYDDSNIKSSLEEMYNKTISVDIHYKIPEIGVEPIEPFGENCAIQIDIEKATPEIHGKLAGIHSMIGQLGKLIKQINEVMVKFPNLKNTIKPISGSDGDRNSKPISLFDDMWKETFKNKKTEFYNNLLQGKDDNGKPIHVLTKDEKSQVIPRDSVDPSRGFSVNVVIQNDTDLEDVINKLENTFSFLTCLMYVIMKYAVTLMYLNESEKESGVDDTLVSLEADVKNYGKRLLKSSLTNFAKYEDSYLEITKVKTYKQSTTDDAATDDMVGGNPKEYPFLLVSTEALTEERCQKISFTKLEHMVYTKCLDVIKNNNGELDPKHAIAEVANTFSADLRESEEVTKQLFDLLAIRLGDPMNYEKFTKLLVRRDSDLRKQGKIPEGDKVTTIEELIKFMDKISDEQQRGGKNNFIKAKRYQRGGVIVKQRPRLDPFRKELSRCLGVIRNFAATYSTILSVLDKTDGKVASLKDMERLQNLRNKLLETIESGRNNYIKVIPMIFFVVEFPPGIYVPHAVDNDYYKFTFGQESIAGVNGAPPTDKYMIKYSHMKSGGNGIKLYDGAHATFFDFDQKNATEYLLTDPLISLEKILKVDSDESKPQNKVINMMFALGASGTGKTTRYFGKEDAPNPKDKEGVVSYIIKKASEESNVTVDLAYFVCYGQLTELPTEGARPMPSYSEYVIFFSNPLEDGYSEISENDKYMPYFMPQQEVSSGVHTYTQFYKKLTTKKFSRLNYSDIKQTLDEGKILDPSVTGDNVGTFRELLETNNDTARETKIWLKLGDPKNSEQMSRLFESLLGEQKKINTVMPTKNNIESSRGHTCVLIRFTKEKDGKKSHRYFPLFDMAGTEDPDGIREFFSKFTIGGKSYAVKKDKMAKTMRYINEQNGTIKDEIEDGQPPVALQSLNDMLTRSNTARKYMLEETPMAGGGKTVMVKEITEKGDENTNFTQEVSENYLNKVIKEGYYINHTIATLILASLCVGTSVNSVEEKEIGEDGKVSSTRDEFDDLETNLFQQLQNNMICLIQDDRNLSPEYGRTCNNTRYLFGEYSFDAILNTTCMWTQILFGFLYWNKETEQSGLNILTNLGKDDFEPLPYLIEMNQQGMDYPGSGMKIEKICNEFTVENVDNAINFLNGMNGSQMTWDSSKIIVGNKFNIDLSNSVSMIEDTIEPYPTGSLPLTKKGLGLQDQSKTTILDIVGKLDFIGSKLKVVYEKIRSKLMLFNGEYFDGIVSLSTDSEIIEVIEKLQQYYIFYHFFNDDVDNQKSTSENKKTSENPNTGPYKTIYWEKRTVDNNLPSRVNQPDIFLFICAKDSPQDRILPPYIGNWNNVDTNNDTENKKRTKIIKDYIIKIRNLFGNLNVNDLSEYVSNKQSQKFRLAFNESVSKVMRDITLYNNLSPEINKRLAIQTIVKLEPSSVAKALEVLMSIKIFLDYLKTNGIDPKTKITDVTESQIEENHMQRVKDKRSSATKMTLMHLVTGQTFKREMVTNTLELCQLLYNATDLKLVDTGETTEVMTNAVKMFSKLKTSA